MDSRNMPLSIPEGRLVSPYYGRMLLTLDVPQEGGLDFINPPVTNGVLNDFDRNSFLHGIESDNAGDDVSIAASFMDPEIES